jgi:uncharacterized protein YjbJ (UPF0337 family)
MLLSGLAHVGQADFIQTEGESPRMNWNQSEGRWKRLKGSARQQWGKLTDSDLEQIAGKREVLIGKLQERYGFPRDQAQKNADEWIRALQESASQTAQESHQTANG